LKPTITDESLPLRLGVQDVYEIEGRRVAVGKVSAGHLSVGDPVNVSPSGAIADVAGLEKFEGPIDLAVAGESIGFTIGDSVELRRGMTLSTPADSPKQTETLTASVFWMSPEPLKRGQTFAVRLGTQEVACCVTRISNRMDSGSLEIISEQADELADTEVAELTLSSDTPVSYDSFARIPEMGRLVLMRGSNIVAGGIIA